VLLGDRIRRLGDSRDHRHKGGGQGQGGDGGGYVRLIDNYSRRVLRQSPYLPQVSSFSSSSIAWRERDVTVRLDADPDTISEDWPLRRP